MQFKAIFGFRIVKKVKDLQCRSHELADDYYAISAEIQHLSNLLRKVEIP